MNNVVFVKLLTVWLKRLTSAMCSPGQNWELMATRAAGLGENCEKERKIQKAQKIQYMSSLIFVWFSVGLCFSASQVGWFPSTYVEEED